MPANPWRGEVEIILDNTAYILRPTFAALNAIEQKLGIGLVALAGKLADGNITLEALSVIITQCATQPLPDIRDSLVRGALSNCMQEVGNMFTAVFGGYDGAG